MIWKIPLTILMWAVVFGGGYYAWITNHVIIGALVLFGAYVATNVTSAIWFLDGGYDRCTTPPPRPKRLR